MTGKMLLSIRRWGSLTATFSNSIEHCSSSQYCLQSVVNVESDDKRLERTRVRRNKNEIVAVQVWLKNKFRIEAFQNNKDKSKLSSPTGGQGAEYAN